MPLITAQALAQALPRCPDPAGWAEVLNPAMALHAIDTRDRVAAFVAQTGHESGQFALLEEGLNYTAPRLVKVWPKRFPTVAAAQPYAGNPQALANLVYAKRLGNGDVASGDGYRYRGRGLIQVTGRSNYAEASKALGIDAVASPDLLLQKQHAAMSACWFWASRGLSALADDRTGDDDLEDFTAITRAINGGTVGLQERLALFHAVEDAMA